ATSAVVQAAVAGQGVALVRRALVANEIATRRLCELFPERRWPIRWAYYVVAAPQSLRRREVTAFYEWLVEDVSKTPTLPAFTQQEAAGRAAIPRGS
ncbi:MAG TPA: LysR substrate-binding domain-containing protein, partial [Rhizomicrobium sp.]|nr:LysR substrate-binding domain-containing protein [Rhizomicrobium sp.]